ncbi:MAG: hypothetical protein AAGK47_07400, partial [Bacteroidota bacterium]
KKIALPKEKIATPFWVLYSLPIILTDEKTSCLVAAFLLLRDQLIFCMLPILYYWGGLATRRCRSYKLRHCVCDYVCDVFVAYKLFIQRNMQSNFTTEYC